MKRRPLVWALMSHRAGESQQILGLGEALERHLGAELRLIQPSWTPQASTLGLLRQISLAGIHRTHQAALGARSPDVLITAGLRNEPLARWVARRSRGHAVTVVLGRTWAPHDVFDLIVTTPQYRLAPRPNVLVNAGTLHRLTKARLDAARTEWGHAYSHLPRPRLGVLVGGSSGPFHLGPNNAGRLAARARALAGTGSLMGTTSSRTPSAALKTLRSVLDPSELWAWTHDAPNPYFGILAWADALLVTGDSIAMVSEAVATGKPVRIFDMGDMRYAGSGVQDNTLTTHGYRWLMRHAHPRLSRDLRPAHAALIARGHAAWDDAPLPVLGGQAETRPITDDIDAALDRIDDLLARRR